MPRWLKAGEAVPVEPPAIRGRSSHGYVRLQWGRGEGALLVYEHRVRDGCVIPAGYEVHHINHQKDDNRPENLQVITRREHSQYHNPMTFDVAEAAALYAEGWSTPRLAERYGVANQNIWTALQRYGYPVRDKRTAAALRKQRRVNSPMAIAAEALYASGLHGKEIARRFGVPQGTIIRMLHDRGVKVLKNGGRYRNLDAIRERHLARRQQMHGDAV